MFTASAPGKVILTGEHAVVYNEPALVMALDRRAYVGVATTNKRTIELRSPELHLAENYRVSELEDTSAMHPSKGRLLAPYLSTVRHVTTLTGYTRGLTIEIHSEIPQAAGLGSSAAVAVALTTAVAASLGLTLKKEQISSAAFDAERIIHGQPSGIDNLIATYGGLLVFRKNEGFLPVKPAVGLDIVVCMSGVERSTGTQVSKVASTVKVHEKVGELVLHSIGHLTVEMVESLRKGNLENAGKLLTINHWLLNALGVSHPLLDRLVYASLRAGALGAKLTGAGGGGCMIALVTKQSRPKIIRAISKEGFNTMPARLSRTGVRLEN